MQASSHAAQDPGVAKIRALLLAASPAIVAGSRALSDEFKQPLHTGDSIPNRSDSIRALIDRIGALRLAVERAAIEGAAAVNARQLTVNALLDTEQALSKVVDTYAVHDQRSSTILLSESVRLLKGAKIKSTAAGKALGIPWPLK